MILTKKQKQNIDILWDFYGVSQKRKDRIVLELEKKLSYSFKNSYLLLVALTHSSAAKGCVIEGSPFYERFEFLGDSVLSLCMSDILIKSESNFSEGDLSKIRSYLVREDYLLKIGDSLGLRKYMLIGKSFGTRKAKQLDSVVADMVEAILGAIYLDSSYSRVHKVVENIYGVNKKDFSSLCESFLQKDYKTVLQEYIQETYKQTPVYSLNSCIEDKDQTSFEMKVSYCDREFSAVSSSKRKASSLAAKKALIYEGRLKKE